jgi:hypothetical protein
LALNARLRCGGFRVFEQFNNLVSDFGGVGISQQENLGLDIHGPAIKLINHDLQVLGQADVAKEHKLITVGVRDQ